MNKFAFLLHPRKEVSEDIAMLTRNPIFKLASDTGIEFVLRHINVPPINPGSISVPLEHSLTAAQASTGAFGHVIMVPLSARQMLSLPQAQVRRKINQAIDRAVELGCSIVGLGALTAPVTGGGKTLIARQDISITNGNAFTAAMTFKAIERLRHKLPEQPHIAIVGATGSVGSCLTRLSVQHALAGKLTLMARNTGKLEKLKNETTPHVETQTSTDMNDLASADLVVLLTSSPDTLLQSEHLKQNAVVLDDTQPRNTHPSLLEQRPDVTLVDGGLVDMPGMTYKGSVGLPPGILFACMAETVLLALEGQQGHFSIGEPTLEQAEYTLALAQKFSGVGFQLSEFHAFGKPLKASQLQQPHPRFGTARI